jgi:large subunit ribosomal protein L21
MNLNTEDSIKKFTIVQASGRQFLLEPGKWYDVNKVVGNEEDIVQLQRILLHKNEEKIYIGKPCIDSNYVVGKILQNFRGKKTCVLKYKPKKKYTRKMGFRPSLSRILIKRTFEKINN